jgi:hypothetical protein
VVTGDWSKLHNELHNAQYLGDQTKKNEMSGAYGIYGERRDVGEGNA